MACIANHGPVGGVDGRRCNGRCAGRSPSYLLRQLLAFRAGTRATAAGTSMQPVVANLSIEDMIAVAAYAGSLPP